MRFDENLERFLVVIWRLDYREVEVEVGFGGKFIVLVLVEVRVVWIGWWW